MADTMMADGKQLRRNILECKQSTGRDRKSRLLWPNQPNPTDQE